MFNVLYALQSILGRRIEAKDEGATMVEYGLMVALIAVVVALAVGPLGTAIAQLFTDVTTSITGP
jgi:pilus assembly protein Flp/PilA